MTNKEALAAVVRVSIPDSSYEKSMLDRDVNPAATYTKENAEAIDLCAIELLSGLLSDPDVSEGGYSIKFDRGAVQKRLISLATKHGASDILSQYSPSVTSPSVW